MNKRQQGNECEKRSKELLEKQGYLVEQARPTIVWIPRGKKRVPIAKHHDFFGKFDLIAVKDKEVIFIQVKFLGENSHGHNAQVENDLKDFPPVIKQIHIWRKPLGKYELEIKVIKC